MRTFTPQRCKPGDVLVVAHDPRAISTDANDARSHDLLSGVLKVVIALEAFAQLVFRIEDPRERTAVMLALDGRGKPAGVQRCEQRTGEVIVRLDPAITPPALVRHLVEIERRRYAAPPQVDVAALDDAALARLVAEAIQEPELDENRILEHLVPELDAP